MSHRSEPRGYMVMSWGEIGMKILKWSVDAQYLYDKDITSVAENIQDAKSFIRLKHGCFIDPYCLAFGRICLTSHQAIDILHNDGILKDDTAQWAHHMVNQPFRRKEDLDLICSEGIGTANSYNTYRN